tara:strand:+ start:1011 stop:1133 length:123 start_codon:yes stop_codon:yes gene_type:complete
MEAIYAGILAWTIELTIAVSILGILKKEERKVIERRKNKP